ncbi:hypothetical protein CEXT_650301 [Caerostris extrusa]|uniref:Uncharacterized protein n=1 Tax=Caerostris extrusa TaxID=172846 RepID=A0AAV4N1G3_CAEEX|nr:hypothetical protein CEXT_650301 [Caerostris extrusa]
MLKAFSTSEGTAVLLPDMPSSSQGVEEGILSASGARPKTKRMLALIKRQPKKSIPRRNEQMVVTNSISITPPSRYPDESMATAGSPIDDASSLSNLPNQK